MSALEVGRVLAGYRVEAVAGRGGMGVVYRATQLGLERTVALKLIAAEFAQDEAFRERFQQESRVLASVDHPHVLTVYEADEAEGQLFISMRWIEGTDLSRLVKGGGGLDRGRAARIVAQVASALDAAHARGLVHRDIKPGNVLIEQREGQEHAWLADFGLAKKAAASSGGMTATGQFVGTLDYLAPEQIQGGSVDARADVYALGCVLFESLTGRVPYPRDSEPAKLFAHITEPPPRPRELRPELPDECDRIVARAMAKDPAERYPSAGDLGRAALAAAAGRASHEPERSVAAGGAAPAPAATTVAAPTPRRRLPRAALATAAIALLLATAAIAAIALTGDDEEPERTASPAAATGALPEPREPQIDRISLGPRSEPGGVTESFGDALVVDRQAGELVRVDHISGQVVNRLKIGEEPTEIAPSTSTEGAPRVLVSSQRRKMITEIDPDELELAGRPFRVPRPPTHVASQPDDVLVASDRLLMRIGKETHQPVGKGVRFDDPVGALTTTTGPLVATTASQPTLISFTHELKFPNVSTLDLEGTPVVLAKDEGASSDAWLALRADDPEADGTVVRLKLDLAGAEIVGKPIAVGARPAGIGFDELGVAYVAGEDGTLTRIDTESGRMIGARIDLGERDIEGSVAGTRAGVIWVSGADHLFRIKP